MDKIIISQNSSLLQLKYEIFENIPVQVVGYSKKRLRFFVIAVTYISKIYKQKYALQHLLDTYKHSRTIQNYVIFNFNTITNATNRACVFCFLHIFCHSIKLFEMMYMIPSIEF